MAQVSLWNGCYNDSWQGLFGTPDAWSHPAKVAPGLAARIYQHLRRQGDVRPGDTICDPFGGVACGAYHALAYGLRWIGCEIEERFCVLGRQNLAYWRQRYGWAGAALLQGDSRHLRAVLAEAAGTVQAWGAVGSPPYAESGQDYTTGWKHIDRSKGLPTTQQRGSRANSQLRACYGTTPGQLGALPTGDVSAIVSSPPFQSSTQVNRNPQDMTAGKAVWAGGTDSAARVKQDYAPMESPGQLAVLPPGDVGAVLSSPPYEGSVSSQSHGIDWAKTGPATGTRQRGEATQCGATLRAQLNYGTTSGQLGNTTGDTFWSASATIMAEIAALLRPGAMACWIVKPFVRNGALVDFPGQWQALCEHHGFVLVERIEASLVQEHGEQLTLDGGSHRQRTKRVSFFRRLAENKGAPSIDAEIILILRKV